MSWPSESYFFDYEGRIKKSHFISDFDQSALCRILNSGSSGSSAQNETDVKIYILYLKHFLMCWMFDKMLWKQNTVCCAVYRLYCIQWTLRHWQCDSTVLDKWFAVFGRIVVPSSWVSSAVWLDPEDDGTGHTATQCPIPKDLNLPTSTFGNLGSPLAYILLFCVISVTERWMCCYTATDYDCTAFLRTADSVTACFSLAGCPEASICPI
jgi:hypothetical protein